MLDDDDEGEVHAAATCESHLHRTAHNANVARSIRHRDKLGPYASLTARKALLHAPLYCLSH